MNHEGTLRDIRSHLYRLVAAAERIASALEKEHHIADANFMPCRAYYITGMHRCVRRKGHAGFHMDTETGVYWENSEASEGL